MRRWTPLRMISERVRAVSEEVLRKLSFLRVSVSSGGESSSEPDLLRVSAVMSGLNGSMPLPCMIMEDGLLPSQYALLWRAFDDDPFASSAKEDATGFLYWSEMERTTLLFDSKLSDNLFMSRWGLVTLRGSIEKDLGLRTSDIRSVTTIGSWISNDDALESLCCEDLRRSWGDWCGLVWTAGGMMSSSKNSYVDPWPALALLYLLCEGKQSELKTKDSNSILI